MYLHTDVSHNRFYFDRLHRKEKFTCSVGLFAFHEREKFLFLDINELSNFVKMLE